ncbi:hypothetical protein J6W20_01450 [bacterium]|nr:hypothetical protein [bacterium]
MELNRYGLDFVDKINIPYGDNGYSLMKFGFTKDYITACCFIIFGVIGFVFVNTYVFKMRKYQVCSFILQKFEYVFVYNY